MRGKKKSFFMTIDGVNTEVKRCPKCGDVKKIDEFPLRTFRHIIKTKHGLKTYVYTYLNGYCKKCYATYQREYNKRTDRKYNRRNLWKQQGMKYRGEPMSYKIYDELLEYQQHKCAICGVDDSFNRLVADHDHKIGEVRGLICSSCNILAVSSYEQRRRYRTEHHTEVVRKYLSDPPINHIPTSVKHGWKYEIGVFPSPSEDNEMEEVMILSPMDIWEEEE